MSAEDNSYLAPIYKFSSPDELNARAAKGYRPAVRPRVNSHIHLPPNFTAFESTGQALKLADEQDVRVLGASNYYDYSVYADFASEASKHRIFPLFGLEIIVLLDELVQEGIKINDPGNPGKMYICGKGITRFSPMTENARQLIQVIRDNDSQRMTAITGKLSAVFAAGGLVTGLNSEAVKERLVARLGCPRETVYLQERHIAQAFQEMLFEKVPESERTTLLERVFGARSKAEPGDAAAVQNEIRSHLMKAGKPAFVEDTFVDLDHAYHLILELGGIPCYPTLADATDPICPFEDPVERLISDVRDRGVHSAEFIPVRNTPEVLSHYVRTMRDAGLFVTAGTEHNTLELLPLEPTCMGGAPIPEDIKEIFWEGACVIAAHQYLTLHGQPGFVDPQGNLNTAYQSDNERIEAFHRLGAAVVAQYQEVCA